jgi:NADH-quinone oxidoreductase subunit L
VVTHAFFKALLFLGAGSVIHALGGEQDVRNMGGLRKKIPWTFWTMMCAAVAIAGVPPFSGFFSKDAILSAADHQAPWMYWVGVVTAGMTAFYVFRAMFLAFFGDYRGKAHPHESPFVMTGPLVVLAILSLGGGFFFKIPEFLSPIFPLAKEADELGPVIVSVAFGLGGIFLAWVFYVWKPALPGQIASTFSGLYNLIYNKYFVDEVYDAVVVRPVVGGSRLVLWKGVDVAVIDGTVNGAGRGAAGIGGILKRLQSGNIRSYAAWILVGSVFLLFVMGVMGGLR